MVIARAALVLACLCATARADSPKLAQARAAIDNVHFDEAQRLLVGALADGGNSAAAVRQIYELSANVAAVLGQRDVAEQYYRRWLALEPQARLGDDVPPKLAEAFVAAQAYMAAHGRLVATVRRTDRGLDVAVESDPLTMAASANGVPFGGDRHALVAPADRVAILDERANLLLELAVPPATEAPVLQPAPLSHPPFLKRWQTWGAVSGTLMLAGAIWGIVAINENTALQAEVEKSGAVFFSDVDQHYRTMRRNATISLSIIGAGALVGIPAAILYVKSRHPSDLSGIKITLGPGRIGVLGRF